jgi:hypothetical protein
MLHGASSSTSENKISFVAIDLLASAKELLNLAPWCSVSAKTVICF